MTETAPAHRVAAQTRRRRQPSDDQPTLELDFDQVANDTPDALVARGSAYARRYGVVEGQQTVLLRNIAVVLVALRRQHDDMLGRTPEYKEDAARIYAASGIPSDRQSGIQGSVRYHVSNVLHSVYDRETLADYGLVKGSSLERLQTRQQARAALVVAAQAEEEPPADGQPVGKVVADHLRLGSGVLNIVNSMSPDYIRAMTDDQRAVLDERLAAAQEAIRKLRRITKPRR